jgi:hypothetical protein
MAPMPAPTSTPPTSRLRKPMRWRLSNDRATVEAAMLGSIDSRVMEGS